MRRAVRSEVRQSALNMRTTESLRRHLENEAAKSGRTLSHEVEYRLERSFAEDGTYTTSVNAGILRDLASFFMLIGFQRDQNNNAAQRDIIRAAFYEILAAHLPVKDQPQGLAAAASGLLGFDLPASAADEPLPEGIDYEKVKAASLKVVEAVIASSHLTAFSSIASQPTPPFGFHSDKFAAKSFVSHVAGQPMKLSEVSKLADPKTEE